MIRTPQPLLRTLVLLVSGLTTTAWALGQDPAPAKPAAPTTKLEGLLRQLADLEPAAWKARTAELQAAAKKAEAEAVDLIKQAEALKQQAAARRARAAALTAEAERLASLRKLLDAGVTAGASAAVPAAPAVAAATGSSDAKKAAPQASKAKAEPASPQKAEPAKAVAAAATDTAYITWDDHIEDLMFDQCAVCHEAGDAAGGLDVSTFSAIREGGASGRTLVPGNPDGSRLFLMVAHREKPVMPKSAAKLSADKIAMIRTWIEQGASRNAHEAKAFVAAKNKAAAEAAAEAKALRAGSKAGPMPVALPDVPLATPSPSMPIRAMVRSPNAPLVAVAGKGQVLLLDETGQRLGVLACPFPAVQALGFSADGTLLGVAGGIPGKRGQACVFEIETGRMLGTYGKLRDTALAVAVDAVHGIVALGGTHAALDVFALEDGKRLYRLPHPEWVLTCAFSADGGHLASGDRAGRLWLWDARSGKDIHRFAGHDGGVHAVAFSPTGQALASVGQDGSLRLWDPATGKQRWSKTAHPGGALAVAHGLEAIATGGTDGCMRLWKTDGNSLRAPGDLGDWIYAVALLDDDGIAWAGAWNGQVHSYDREAPQVQAARSLGSGARPRGSIAARLGFPSHGPELGASNWGPQFSSHRSPHAPPPPLGPRRDRRRGRLPARRLARRCAGLRSTPADPAAVDRARHPAVRPHGGAGAGVGSAASNPAQPEVADPARHHARRTDRHRVVGQLDALDGVGLPDPGVPGQPYDPHGSASAARCLDRVLDDRHHPALRGRRVRGASGPPRRSHRPGADGSLLRRAGGGRAAAVLDAGADDVGRGSAHDPAAGLSGVGRDLERVDPHLGARLQQARRFVLGSGTSRPQAAWSIRSAWLWPVLLQLALLGAVVVFHFSDGANQSSHVSVNLLWVGGFDSESKWLDAFAESMGRPIPVMAAILAVIGLYVAVAIKLRIARAQAMQEVSVAELQQSGADEQP